MQKLTILSRGDLQLDSLDRLCFTLSVCSWSFRGVVRREAESSTSDRVVGGLKLDPATVVVVALRDGSCTECISAVGRVGGASNVVSSEGPERTLRLPLSLLYFHPKMTNPPRDANEQAHLLIARFLSHQNYSATLSSFLEESTSKHPQLRLNPHQSNDEQEDWNDVVEEWIAKKVTQIKLQDGDSKLRDELAKLESTREERMPSKVRTVVKEASNILNVRKGTVPRKEWDSAALEFKSQVFNLLESLS